MSLTIRNFKIIIILIFLVSVQAFSQQINYRDTIIGSHSERVRPQMHYSLGSSITVIPHLGTLTGLTVSPFLSIPLSPKFLVEGGVIAAHYYMPSMYHNAESNMNWTFNGLTVYASASYRINSQFTVYGAGIKQLTSSSQSYLLPKSSFTIGSNFNFGSFSIGAALQMSKMNDSFHPFPYNSYSGFYPPFDR